MIPTKLDIGDLMSSRSPFKVPKYQRSYAWDTEEIDDFIKDVKESWNYRKLKKKSIDHFFGGMVSIQRSVAGTLSGREYEVIDGQQRLATIMILFANIVRGFDYLAVEARPKGGKNESKAKSKVDSIKDKYLEIEDTGADEDTTVLRLKLSKVDQDFFSDIIIGTPRAIKPSRESHRRISKAYGEIWEMLINPIVADTTKTIQIKIQNLWSLTQVITNDCYVIHLVTESPSEAYRLFQVLNDRGVGLSAGDLLRSTTLEMLDSSKFRKIQNEIEEHWDVILAGEESSIKQFLTAYYASNTGERPNKYSLYDDFCKKFLVFKDRDIGVGEAKEVNRFVSELNEETLIYNKIIQGDWPYKSGNPKLTAWDIERLLLLIKSLKHTLIMPLLLAAVKLPETTFSSMIQLIERFVFRYINICKQHPGRLSQIYYNFAGLIRKDPKAFKLSELKSELITLQNERADENLFIASLTTRLVYNEKGGNKELLYFLSTIEYYSRWIEEARRGTPKCLDKSFRFHLSKNNIEHIYPRNPRVPIGDMEIKKNQLGNLSFWSQDDNMSAGNKEFSFKKPLYRKSRVNLTRELGRKRKWDSRGIDGRTKMFITRAIKVFRI